MSILGFGSDDDSELETGEYEEQIVQSKYDVNETRPDRWGVTEDGTPPEADPDVLSEMMDVGDRACHDLIEILDERTVDVLDDVVDDDFFSEGSGANSTQTIVTRYDLEKSVPMEKKEHFREIDRYWVNKPYAFISLFKSRKDNEVKYYAVEPYTNPIEEQVKEFFSRKLRTAIKYTNDDVEEEDTDEDRREVIENKTRELLDRYNLYDPAHFSSASGGGFLSGLKSLVGLGGSDEGMDYRTLGIEGVEARPEPAVLAENNERLSAHQVQMLLYYLKRDFIGYERIDPIKNDINVEDISCNGYYQPVFAYHGEHEQIITNIIHGKKQLDDFVVKLAQRSGKGISKRNPQVDATLPDGSRSQLTLGAEVSGKGTNYTIRQFKDVPFTPVDLINWRTFGLGQMAFLWLCIENNKSLIFAGGTASGKTTSLNAISLFIPSSEKIVSIEDTREVELPQRNWIASVTRPSFSGDKGNVDEFALLEAALRQRPDYIVMGEIRGEEGRTLFQVMSTGHTTYTTFHADSVGEVLKRFTTDPINVSKTLFTALDLVSIQTATRVEGNKVRRNENLTEINHYDAENDEINVQDVYEWQPANDEFLALGESQTVRGTATFEEIMFNRGWSESEAWDEIRKRKMVIAYLILNGLNTYTEVAATVQAFINDQDTILALITNDALEEQLGNLRDMESVLIDVTEEDEASVPRPDPDEEMVEHCEEIMEETKDLREKYQDIDPEKVIIEDTLTAAADATVNEPLDPAEEQSELEPSDQTEEEDETEESSDDLFATDSDDKTDKGDFDPL